MKKLIKIAVILFIVSSCNNDFMERQPLTAISDAGYWNSANDLRIYVNYLYNRTDLLPHFQDGTENRIGIYGHDASYGGMNGTDTQVGLEYNTRMNGETVVPGSGGGWANDDWLSLRSINHFMDNYSKAGDSEEVMRYVGEALYFRALFYFTKLRRFGDVPWASTVVTTTSDVLFEPRLPRNQVVDSIMYDLDRAVEYIPARAGGAWTGRITKETAMTLQARIALYEGTWEKYHANSPFAAAVNQSVKFLQKAADVADALISMSEASGYPALDNVGVEGGYRDLFCQEDYSNSKEVIFWRKYEQGIQMNWWNGYTHTGAALGVTKSLIDSYLKADGTPVAAGYDDATLVKVAENRDPRLAQTVCINDGKTLLWALDNPPRYFIAPTFDQGGQNDCATGYQTYKGHNFWQRPSNAIVGGQGLSGLILFRFAEALLIYAEAKAELGTITQADLDRSVNKLRDRVNMPHLNVNVTNDPNFEFSTLPPVIQEVRRERKVEYACEGYRYDDIMRWAAAGELIAGKTPLGSKVAQWLEFNFADFLPQSEPDLGRQATFTTNVNTTLVANENGYIKPFKNLLNGGTEGYRFNLNRDYLYPIPTQQLTINPQLKQNPGWD